ncbi:MAG: flagellar motor switch protein FliM [Methylovulum sp.]|jgi:flagellar motor switch protein FliM|nr:flagellar motor switch protein FliM [Methylovulum sp.]TSA41771.1 MAG: flagellar motor switch protein FliM [Methylococcaceae bacterium]
MSDLLSQEEIDALLYGVDEGEIPTDSNDSYDKSIVREYNFGSQERIIRGRMPTMEMVNERFTRLLRNSLFLFLRRSAEVFITGIQVKKFSEYVLGLHVPTNLNIIRVAPLRGRALVVIESPLVFTLVENFFGGGGQFHPKMDGREYSATEMRVIKLVIDILFKDLKIAWKPVIELDFEYLGSETNPQFANIVSPAEIVVISALHIELEGGGGDINITMPYSMLEPIRDLLVAISSDAGETDGSFQIGLRNELLRTEMEANCLLVEKNITLRDVMSFKKGDIIPFDMAKTLTLDIGGVRVFDCKVGVSDGNYAVQILNQHIDE